VPASFSISPVVAASGYQWQAAPISPYTYLDGAENGLTNLLTGTNGAYSLFAGDIKFSGFYSYHLAHVGTLTTQYLTLARSFYIHTNSTFSFAKRLGYATTDEIARAQVSTDSGATWKNIWSQSGLNSSGDSGFTLITNSLSSYSNQVVQLRLAYELSATAGSWYNSAASTVGLYLDDIAVANCDQMGTPTSGFITNTVTFAYTPAATNDLVLTARAQINSRTLAWGPALKTSVAKTPVLQITGKPTISAGQVLIDFNVTNYTAGLTFQLWRAPDVSAAWALDTNAAISTLIANQKFRATTTLPAASRYFYRIKAF
jgi:hypothetical protein